MPQFNVLPYKDSLIGKGPTSLKKKAARHLCAAARTGE